MQENKSVVDYLENIEDNVGNKTLSQMIGENFDEYFLKSTVYYFEPNEVEFHNFQKRQIKTITIFLIVFILSLILTIYILYKYNESKLNTAVNVVLLIAQMFPIGYAIFDIIYNLRNKSKKLASSKYNKINTKFYFYDNYLGKDVSQGFIVGLKKVIFTINIILYVIVFFVFLTKGINYDDDFTLNSWLLSMSYLISAGFVILYSSFITNDYYYPGYILDTKDSYVRFYNGECKKFNK